MLSVLTARLWLLVAATIFVASFVLLPMPVLDDARRSMRSNVSTFMTFSTPAQVETASIPQQPLPEFHLCRANQSNAPDRPYLCEGPAYDDFADRMLRYAHRQGHPTWGRRPFPLPDNSYVFMLGNSHTRQVYNTLLCEYRNIIQSSRQHDNITASKYTSFGSTVSYTFANNATLVTVSNSPLVYNKDRWAATFEKLLDKPMASMDAIIMGRFNRFENRSNYGREIIDYSQAHPELFDKDFSSPTIESLAAIYQGPIVAVPMFAPHGQDVRESAERAQQQQLYSTTSSSSSSSSASSTTMTSRTNIKIVDARYHIGILGECGSDSISTMGVCRNPGDGLPVKDGREPEAMHRCTGMKGGHPDLIAWDIIERLYELLL